jgi:DNA-binding NarL/FixJ family response regulator
LFNGISRHERYQRTKEQQIQNGALKTKSQKLEETYQQIIELQKQGYKRKDIETQLGIPHRTMSRYIRKIKEINNDN